MNKDSPGYLCVLHLLTPYPFPTDPSPVPPVVCLVYDDYSLSFTVHLPISCSTVHRAYSRLARSDRLVRGGCPTVDWKFVPSDP